MGKSTILKKLARLTVWKYAVVSAFCALIGTAVTATPVEVDWKAGETAPATVARQFAGFLPDGRFVVAGGSNFIDGEKVYSKDIFVRKQDGKWAKVGELPRAVAEGVCCGTPKGVFCAGGTDGKDKLFNAFLLSV
jgi:N-acetylneuraminic acid mutarotase